MPFKSRWSCSEGYFINAQQYRDRQRRAQERVPGGAFKTQEHHQLRSKPYFGDIGILLPPKKTIDKRYRDYRLTMPVLIELRSYRF